MSGSSSTKLGDKVKREVDEVVGVIQNNIDKILERGERTHVLESKSGKAHCFYFKHTATVFVSTEDLNNQAKIFQRSATAVRRRAWWKEMKVRLAIGGVLATLILIIVGM
jgi:vesicle-associated membrane protein 4